MNFKQKTVRAITVFCLFMAFSTYIYLMQGMYELITKKDGISFKSAILFAAILFSSSITWDVCKHLLLGLPQKRFDNFVTYLVLSIIYGVSYLMTGFMVYESTNQLTSMPSLWFIPIGILSVICAMVCSWSLLEAVSEATSS